MKRKHVILIIGVLLLAWILSIFRSAPPTGTTYSAHQSGTKALYLLLESTGYDVQRFFEPFIKLNPEDQDAVLFIIAPPNMGGEADLLNWVGLGNTLVVFGHYGSPLENLRKLLAFRDPETPRNFSFSFSDEEPSIKFHCPVGLEALCGDVHTLSTSFFTPSFSLQADGQAVQDETTNGTAFYIPYGAGTVWYFSSPDIVLNENIDLHDNARLLFQLATSGSRILIDEFHHGYLAPMSPIVKQQTELVYLFIGLLILWLTLGVSSRFIRFGDPTPHYEQEIPTSVDFVSVLGMLYSERNASSVLENYVAAWRKRLEHRHLISSRLSFEEMLTELVARGVIQKKEGPRIFQALHKLSSATDYDTESWNEEINLLESVFKDSNEFRKSKSKVTSQHKRYSDAA